jgi:hypothetical protein
MIWVPFGVMCGVDVCVLSVCVVFSCEMERVLIKLCLGKMDSEAYHLRWSWKKEVIQIFVMHMCFVEMQVDTKCTNNS